jgi:plasmid maintenance system antidote protein VapI
MDTTRELLDKVKEKFDLSSDNKLAQKIGISRERISRYRHTSGALGADAAVKVAQLLEIDPGYVLACMEAERTDSEAARAEWHKLADRVKPLGVVAALLLLAATPCPTPANAAPTKAGSGICILCKVRRAIASSLSALRRYGWNAYPLTA